MMHILSLVQQNHIMWKSSVFPTTWKGKILLLLLLSLLLLLLFLLLLLLLLFLLLSIPRTQPYLCKIKSLDIFLYLFKVIRCDFFVNIQSACVKLRKNYVWIFLLYWNLFWFSRVHIVQNWWCNIYWFKPVYDIFIG